MDYQADVVSVPHPVVVVDNNNNTTTTTTLNTGKRTTSAGSDSDSETTTTTTSSTSTANMVDDSNADNNNDENTEMTTPAVAVEGEEKAIPSTTTTATDADMETDNKKTSEEQFKDTPDKVEDEEADKEKEQQEEDEESKQRRLAEEKAKEEAEKQRIEELKKKYADWPLRNIKDVHEHDVMYGRGGGTNHHPGNKRYRKMVEDRKLEYVNSKRLDKPLVALEIIRIWRAQLPPGRFLKIDEKTGLWHDVGDKKAREKTSQALREKAPMIRKQLDEEKEEGDAENGDDKDDKTTRFADGTKGESSSKIKKPVMARDHSLGREILGNDEAVSLEGFTWQDPFNKGKPKDGSMNGAGPAPPGHYAVPAGRTGSSGSIGLRAPYHQSSIGGAPPPPPPPDYYGRIASGDQRREFSNSSIGSWGPYTSFSFPPPPPPPGHATHQRSGSWTHPFPPASPHHHGHHQRSGSWGSGIPTGRDHSLSYNPLAGANVGHPADRGAFDGRAGSGYWGEQVRPPPPPPPPSYYGGIPYMSSGSMGGYGPPPGAHPGYGPPTLSPTAASRNNATPSPPYNVNMDIARTWSGGDVRPTPWMPGQGSDPAGPNPYDSQGGGGNRTPPPGGPVPRPHMVKRDTSNQNEQPMIKKAALNRDQSATSNRLKREYMPDYFHREMQALQETTEQIRLSPAGGDKSSEPVAAPKPQSIATETRTTTFDIVTAGLMAKPSALMAGDRVSTIDALDLDLESSDHAINTDGLDQAVAEATGTAAVAMPKPPALGAKDRLTTQEVLEIVAAPLEISETTGTAVAAGGVATMPRPPALGPKDRLTTQDVLEIVAAPLESLSDRALASNDDDPLPLM